MANVDILYTLSPFNLALFNFAFRMYIATGLPQFLQAALSVLFAGALADFAQQQLDERYL